jgi:hypothetical protein
MSSRNRTTSPTSVEDDIAQDATAAEPQASTGDGGSATMPFTPDFLNTVFRSAMTTTANIQAMANLSLLPVLDIENKLPAPYKGKRFTPGYMNFKFSSGDLQIVLAANGATPVTFNAAKLVAMVDKMHDVRHCTVVLQNHRFPSDKRDGYAQILGRIVKDCSAINIAHGRVGVPIRGQEDILRLDSFQIDRGVIAAFYLAAKYHIGSSGTVEHLIATYEGDRFYEIPTGVDAPVDMSSVGTLIG